MSDTFRLWEEVYVEGVEDVVRANLVPLVLGVVLIKLVLLTALMFGVV